MHRENSSQGWKSFASPGTPNNETEDNFCLFLFLIYKVDHLHDTNFKQLSSPVTDGSVYIDESAKSVGEIISAFQS